MSRQLIPLEQAFWSKVDKRGPDECWSWLGATVQGYGQLHHQGRVFRAHRLAWQLANGCDFPDHLQACHRCDNPGCVNPAHIWPGTQRENIADMIAKGRAKWSGFPSAPKKTHPCSHPRIPGRRCLECKRAYDAEHRERKREYDRAYRTRQNELLRLRRAARRASKAA